MSLEQSIKQVITKFLGEPFTWVCLAMVGVVVVGPATANLARKVAVGNLTGSNVDDQDEPIKQEVAFSPTADSRDAGSDHLKHRPHPTHYGILPDSPPDPNSSRPDTSSAGSDSDVTAAKLPVSSAYQQQVSRDTQNASDVSGSSNRPDDSHQDVGTDNPRVEQMMEEIEGEDSFDVGQMVADVRQDTERDFDVSDLPSGSGAKDVESAEVGAAGNASDFGKTLSEVERDVVGSGSEGIDPVEAAIPAEAKEQSYSIRDDLLPDDADTSPLPEKQFADSNALSEDVDSRDPDVTEISKDEFLSEPADQDMDQPSRPKRDLSTSDQGTMDDDASVFSPWDEPLTIPGGSGSEDTAQDFWVDTNQTQQRNATPSIAPESGTTWWDAMIAQQFWPDRQAQFASIDSVVFMALQNSAQVQILNDRPHIEETFVQQREADFDWSAFVDASWNSINEPVRSELQTGSRTGRFEQDELSVSSRLQKRLDRGGELRVGSSIGTLDNNSIFLAPPDQGTATFSLDYRQPLLRGRGREISQSQIVLARLNVEASQHSVKQQMQEYLVEVVTAYWDLYRARGVLSQRHRNYTRATEIVGRLSEGSSRVPRVQLQRAQATASARHSGVIDAEYIVADAQERLMNLTHGDNLANSNEIEIIPTDATPQSYLPHDLGHVTQLAVQNRAEVKEVLAEIKAASVRQTIALDGLKPQLDAIISSYVAGVRGSKDVGNAIVDQFSAGDPSYAVGMSFEIPIGRRSANAGTRREAIRRRVLENRLRKTLGDVSMSARSAFRDVYRLMAITDNNRQVVTQSADALNSIQHDISWLEKDDPSSALFLNDLLVSQDRLSDAEQNLLDSQAQLAIAYVRLKRATGELLRDNGGAIESDGCSTCSCGGAHCDCSNVSQATWYEPVEQIQGVIENGIDNGVESGKQFIHGVREKLTPSSSRARSSEIFDAPLEQPRIQQGVNPMPLDSDTAGETSSARLRYPLSALRASDTATPRY